MALSNGQGQGDGWKDGRKGRELVGTERHTGQNPHLGLEDRCKGGKEEVSLRTAVREESIEPAKYMDIQREKERVVDDGSAGWL